MDDAAIRFTVPEAGFVLGQPSKAVNKAIDDGEIIATRKTITETAGAQKRVFAMTKSKAKVPQSHKVADYVVREIGPTEVRYLALIRLVKQFNRSGRKQIYQEMRRLPPHASTVKLGPVALELADVDRELAPRVSQLLKLRNSVEQKNGVPVLKGTSVPVYAVAALKEHSTADVQAAYPSLNASQIETAIGYAKVYPKVGRPYPAVALKDRIAELAEAGVFDEVEGLEPLSPKMFK
jgi:uncharacterized protein (DUF433 family)